MPRPAAAATAPRKLPKQARSAELVGAILQAAIRVLARQGADAFTTVRVAEQAGVSVGSLYQYFPNKESILYRLQEQEWVRTGQLLEGIFADRRLLPAERLRAAVRAFFRSECDEAPLRRALGDAAPLYRDAPHARQQRARTLRVIEDLIGQVAAGLPARRRAFAAELYISLMTSMGENLSESGRTPAEVDAWAAATGDMFLAYVRKPKL